MSQDELEAAHCWEASDRVPGRPEMTELRRRLRLHQARWREANRHPIGAQPIGPPKPGKTARPVGSRIARDHALETGANFLTLGARAAATARTASTEAHQTIDLQGLWADLLSSLAMACNLFGDLAADLELADRAVHTWWPDVPGTVRDVRFWHSPGRLDPAYLGNLITFHVAFVLDLDAGAGGGGQGILGLEVRYHERTKRETAKPERLPRYLAVAARSGAFRPGAAEAVDGTDLLVTWLGHLLVLSMLQHPSGDWGWGRYLVVHPAQNTDFATASARYRALLADDSTYSSVTVEELLDAGALPPATEVAFRARYGVA